MKQDCAAILTKVFSCELRKILLQSGHVVQLIVSRVLVSRPRTKILVILDKKAMRYILTNLFLLLLLLHFSAQRIHHFCGNNVLLIFSTSFPCSKSKPAWVDHHTFEGFCRIVENVGLLTANKRIHDRLSKDVSSACSCQDVSCYKAHKVTGTARSTWRIHILAYQIRISGSYPRSQESMLI